MSTDAPQNVIIRLTSDDLRRLADQLDAQKMLKDTGYDHPASNTQLRIDGRALAYLYWWESQEQFMAEFINFVPGDASPLIWHCKD